MKKQIVIGYAFGDEGKGVTTQWLCEEALKNNETPLVIRYSGGPQAGHTVCKDGKFHIFSTFGSGTLLSIPTYLDKNVMFDPIAAYLEYKDIEKKFNIEPILYIHPNCRIITPLDVMAGRKDSKVINDGTCGKGLYPTFKRYNTKDFSSLATLSVGVNNTTDFVKKFWNDVCAYYELEENSMPDYFKMFCDALQNLKFIVRPLLSEEFETYSTYIFEGSQGLLLDMDNGFYPHVTPSKVGLNGIDQEYIQNAEVFLVTRTYTTRHGNGYTPSLPLKYDLSNKYESNVLNTYQGEFKTGGLEIELLRIANDRHCLDNYIYRDNVKFNLVVTHCDLLDGHIVSFCNQLDKKIDNLVFENVYYNDSVNSNVKKC